LQIKNASITIKENLVVSVNVVTEFLNLFTFDTNNRYFLVQVAANLLTK